jgi:DNA-3-methyladenine glycosylase
MIPLPNEFYDRDAVCVARELIGKVLVRTTREGRTAGRIVEVEAYLGSSDPASHSYRGRTRSNASMFGPAGRAYVYPIHSRWCMNAVTGPGRAATAVLIRAVEPTAGESLMARRRGRAGPLELSRGPARLCEAMAIDRRLDGWNLTTGRRLWIAQPPEIEAGDGSSAAEILVTPRIGVRRAEHERLRFCLAGNRFVSRGPMANVAARPSP